MMASLIEMVVYTIVALLAVKLVFLRKEQTQTKPQNESLSWKSAVDTISTLEARLQQLTDRDLKAQERIWALEDLNRDLQHRLARATKELLRVSPPCDSGPTPLDDDDHDAAHSIPPSS